VGAALTWHHHFDCSQQQKRVDHAVRAARDLGAHHQTMLSSAGKGCSIQLLLRHRENDDEKFGVTQMKQWNWQETSFYVEELLMGPEIWKLDVGYMTLTLYREGEPMEWILTASYLGICQESTGIVNLAVAQAYALNRMTEKIREVLQELEG
jgi:hypothetical protein